MPEYFDVVDEQGRPTGQTVVRTYAHAHGVRHRTAHLWLVRRSRTPSGVELLLQKRSDGKDSHPGCYDISSAGHIPAGVDFVPSALRELREELGVTAAPEQLVPCGQRRFRYAGQFHGRPFLDDQVSNIYLLWLDEHWPAERFVLQAEEVSAVRWMDFDEAVRAVRQNAIPHCIYPEELELVRQGIERTR